MRNGGGTANLTVNNLQELGECKIGQVFMAGETPKSAELILDCGATSHMFCDKSFFVTYKPSGSCETITVGDACNIPVAGHGSVWFRSILPKGFHTITLVGALHIPALAANLVSLGKLQREGASVTSFSGGLSVSLKGNQLLCGSLTGDNGTLYHISCLEMQRHTAYVITRGSLRLWHWCLGHLHLDAI